MLAVMNRFPTGLVYSTPREVLLLPCFHFLVANFKIPPYSPSESGNLVCLAGDVADNDTGIP